ncbi:hypothetical protein Moror_1817 [Moniliophthora roreri MCA 2997]|uniref:DUF7223 domain-containing protein n=1 Tax=Moniliophthora roreri (strain MCA 2997) TaxID=1381753 RepID=V2XKN4_MONRO|nr:hypothetical protein Moror_1817 [Moniliophthora roreri MCA 2997]
MIPLIPVLLPLFFGTVSALNDWMKPCHEGECSYDTEQGSLKIVRHLFKWGSPDAITDITTAANWTILNCDKDALAQDIRLVCTDSESGCSHLWQNTGAVGKLVRLPESCGKSAFARISRNWVHEDQSLPPQLAKTLRRRDGTVPEVQGLALDTDFGAIDPAQNGNISFSIQGSNIPGAIGNSSITPTRRSHLAKKGDSDFVEDLFIADAATKANAVVSIGIAAAGTIVPPEFSEFGIFAGLDADLQGTLRLVGSASVSTSLSRNLAIVNSMKGTADSGRITFFEMGLPGLDFHGILTLGPSFKIQGQAKATLDIDADLTVDLAYTVDNAKLFFPKSDTQQSGGDFTPTNTPLKLSVTPSVASKAVVEGHIIPTLQFGVSALGGIAEAVIFVDLDASAAVTLSLNASASVSTNITTPVETQANVTGCLDVGTGLDVNAGADASFFKIFDKNTKVNLFTKKFDLFNKCVGTNTKREVSQLHVSRRRAPLRMLKRDLTCPTFATDIVSVVDEAISAADIKALP